MSLSSRSWFRGLAATSAAVVFAVAGGAAALADIVQDDVVVGVNSSVEVGGKTTVKFRITDNNGDGVTGCNFNSPGDAMTATLNMSGTGSVTPATSTVAFTACDVDVPVVFTGVTVGAVDGELTQVSNNTGGSFNFNPAKFTLNVTAPSKTATTTTVSCPTSRTYTGAAITPCTASVTGTGLSQSLPVTYSANVDVGPVTASAGFAGDATHLASNNSATFAITKAPSTTTVTCPDSATWTGSPLTPCTAAVTGVGGLSQPLTPKYSANTAVGTAAVSASFAGDANHDGSDNTDTFVIDKAGATVTVTCGAGPFTYTGSAQTPCTATVTGAGGLNQSVTVTYDDNLNAGTVTATASFTGDASHSDSTDTDTFVIGQADAVCTVTAYSGSYDADPHHVAGTCTGIGGIDVTSGFTPGQSFTNAGAHTATWVFEGGRNYKDQTGTAGVTIGRASSTTVVDCPVSVTYDGSAHKPCTASVTGNGGLDESLTPTYTDNTNAGTATASANYPGDANHTASNGSDTFGIRKATSSTVVSCPTGPFVYTGSPITPACTASTTGAGSLSASPTVTFAGNTNAGSATASASYPGDTNHEPSKGSATFTIDQATSAVTLICTSPVTYTGAALEPCSAKATGAGGLDVALTVLYEENTDAGTATATASYTGDANHEGSSADATFTVVPAASITTVTCPASVTYTGSALTPCTASVTGVGGLDESLEPTYSENMNAGTATASADFKGDANHLGSTDSKKFAIAKATSTTTVTCPTGPFVYTGSPITPACTASTTGAGGLSVNPPVNFTDNTNAGPAKASASYAGDDNHEGSSGSETFTITKAPSLVTLTCSSTSFVFTGSAITPCSASVAGVGGLSQALTVVYTNNTGVGMATATATYDRDANHESGSASKTFEIAPWRMSGYYQPVDMNGVWNTVKGGSTVQLKFELFAGTTELSATSAVKSFSVQGVACPGALAVADDIELTTTGGTSLRYDTTGGPFVQNWQTPKSAGSCYKVTMTAQDMSTISALFKLK